jgi:hypothetical protein
MKSKTKKEHRVLNPEEREKSLLQIVRESISVHFNVSPSRNKNAICCLRKLRPSQAYRVKDTITYFDLFEHGAYPFPNLELHHQIALIPRVVNFILSDNVSSEAEWSGLLFLESCINKISFYTACSSLQKQAIHQFISFLIDWRLERHGCGVFKDEFEAVLKKWKINVSPVAPPGKRPARKNLRNRDSRKRCAS